MNFSASSCQYLRRFAYFANSLTPPHIDSYHTFSLSAASNVPAVTSPANVDPLATTLLSPRATLQKNEYSCSRNAATRREDTGHHFANYVPGTFDFRQGCKLFQDMETTYSHNQEPASINHSDVCKNGARIPRRLEQSTCNNYVHQQNAPSQQECCTVGSNYRENNAKDKLSTPKAQESGAHVQFLPHKLRFKATSTKVHTEQILNPNSARGRDEAVAENTSSSDSTATRPTNVGEAARNATHFLSPRHAHFPETIQHQAARRFSALWGGSDRTVSTREEAEPLENTRTRAPQNSGACAFSLFRQLSNNNDAGYYGTLCQGMQSAFPLEHERETGESGLRNQLASLGAEVKCLKQMLLAKSTA
ncbi:uncharacterized protein LOC118212975 [Anguilla anguilla]|uniref:uncharacterized protein LOC118212975 n=1 Tax=Anguilla anguilla TaxID=7936 RepID=UPI0015B08C36|nr:uncharacterized protein LOC118212975 [Anguilla anguilla]